MSKGPKDHVVRQIVFQTYVSEQQQKHAKALGAGGGLPFGVRNLNG